MATITIGGNDYFSYSSVADADIYFAASLDAATWSALSTDEKGVFLIQTARLLDRQKWRDGYTTQVLRLATDDIVTASYEIAILLAKGETAVLTSASNFDATKRVKAGSVETENFRNFSEPATRFPTQVHELLADYLLSNSPSLGLISSHGTSLLSSSGTSYGLVDGSA